MNSDYLQRLQQCMDKNPFLPLHSSIREVIFQDIIECRVAPAQKIVESKLAKEFNVSRTSVHRALESLYADGWLVKDNTQSFTVCLITEEHHKALAQIRYFLESAACQIAAYNRTPQDIRSLREAVDEGYSASDLNEFFQADFHFHRAVFNATHNKFFNEINELLHMELSRYKLFSATKSTLMSSPRRAAILEDHNLIYLAIRHSDYLEAKAIGQQHILRSFSKMRWVEEITAGEPVDLSSMPSD